MQEKILTPALQVFKYLVVLTIGFVLLEVSFFIQTNANYFAALNTVKQGFIPASILPPILFYLLFVLFIHVLFTLCVSVLAILFAQRLKFMTAFQWGITCWIIGILTLLFWNQYAFPNSHYAELITALIHNENYLKVIRLGFFALWFFGCILLLWGYPKSVSLLLAGILSYQYLLSVAGSNHPSLNYKRPDIIVIGMDSLRADIFTNPAFQANMPFMHDISAKSFYFEHAFTPLARTFPAWAALLSGQYPIHNGIRTNLAAVNKKLLKSSLVKQLDKLGYQTIYASDETRFSNIDEKFGFQTVITAPMGVLDFILGSFSDFPMINLLVNTWIGKIFLPYSYANRAAFITYQPEQFVQRLQTLVNWNANRPLFLAVHFCLGHFPYRWSHQTFDNAATAQLQYATAMHALDGQIAKLYQWLDANQRLKHAVVIFLSDHGEALNLSHDRLASPLNFKSSSSQLKPHQLYQRQHVSDLSRSAGHGTDVLSFSQYQTFLAIQMLGFKVQAKKIALRASLLDIKPTLESLLQLPKTSNDGINLLPFLLTTPSPLKRTLFFESDFTPQALQSVFPNVAEAVLEGINLFAVNRSQRLEIKPAMEQLIYQSKQFAMVKGNRMLALYPLSPGKYLPIMLRLDNYQWSEGITSAFAKQNHAEQLLAELKKFYAQDLANSKIIN